MMISSDEALAPATNPQECSLCAALQAIIAYADGQEGSRISVSMENGRVMLTGEVETVASLECAVFIAECFASRPIIADLAIRPQIHSIAPRHTARRNLYLNDNRSSL
ncbi:BON domain-containing protein [uncultured Agrobacterium sp.]|uniref:BON domain-containing protein n=1 Tax=uncultured Agrobacterium sp. TaxID=157277 RepID=UPI0025F0EDA2|nr:BON domain-containing protein [uncultured Agrobacterium sp.]